MKRCCLAILLFALASSVAAQQLTETERIYLQTIELLDSTVLSQAEVEEIAAPYLGRRLTFVELDRLREALSQAYRDKGYITSGVIVPDQRLENATVRFQAVEGQLQALHLSGNRRLADSYIESRILKNISRPLDVNLLQDNLQQLRADPRINNVQTRLVPGRRLGDSELLVEVEENSSHHFTLGANNYRPPSVGAEQAYITYENSNLTGWGDQLILNLGITEGVDEIGTSYFFTFDEKGSVAYFDYQEFDSSVVEEPFDEIDLESDLKRYRLGMEYVLHRSMGGSLAASFSLERKRSSTEVLGESFSFTEGVDNGVSRLSVAQAGLLWSWRRMDRMLVLSSSYRKGLDIWNATDTSGPADSEFESWVNQVAYAQDIPWRDSRLFMRINSQLTRDSLLAIEKLAVGGTDTVRGYRENQYLGDNGAVLSMELRIPLAGDYSAWTLIPFVDMGQSWNDIESSKRNLHSVGLGVQWLPNPQLSAEVYWAYSLNHVEGPDDDLQDDGLHFELLYRFN